MPVIRGNPMESGRDTVTTNDFATRHPGAIILPFRGVWPRIAEDAYIAPGAAVIGDVEIGAEASVWFG